MKHLEIKQSTQNIEIVNSEMIDKLYRLAYENEEEGIESQLDSTSDVEGNIQAPAAYEDAVRYLVGIDAGDPKRFQNLYITIPNNNYYIRFKDPVIAQIFNTEYGDGTGTTQAQLTAVTDLQQRFGSNYTDFVAAESYDDMQYLKGISNAELFLFFTNVSSEYFTDTASYNSSVKVLKKKSFTAPSSTFVFSGIGGIHQFVKGKNHQYKVQFDNIDISKSNFIYNGNGYPHIFEAVDIPFENVKFPTYSEQKCRFFTGNELLGKFIYPEGVITVADNFTGCRVNYVEYPSTLQNANLLFNDFRRDGRSGGCIVFKSVVPPTHPTSMSTYSYYCRLPTVIYCPAGSVTAYQTWIENMTYTYDNKTVAQAGVVVKSMAEMSQSERDMGTVTQADIDRV